MLLGEPVPPEMEEDIKRVLSDHTHPIYRDIARSVVVGMAASGYGEAALRAADLGEARLDAGEKLSVRDLLIILLDCAEQEAREKDDSSTLLKVFMTRTDLIEAYA